MQPLSLTLATTFLAGSAGTAPLDVTSSDKRLEVQIQPASLDLSQAKTATCTPFTGPVTVSITELHGRFAGQVSVLGTYNLQLQDAQGHPLSGVQFRTPFTFRYHYRVQDLDAFSLDPGKLLLTWPHAIYTARQQHRPFAQFIVPLHNDPKTHTGQCQWQW